MYGKYNILGDKAIRLLGYWLLAIGLMSCRGDEIIFPAEYEVLPIESRELTSFAPNEPIGMQFTAIFNTLLQHGTYRAIERETATIP